MDAADKILQKALGEKESSQHCSSQCDRDARIRELTEANQTLAEVVQDKTAQLTRLEEQRSDEVAELKKELEQLKGSNVALDEENEHYSEEMVALQRENESLKEKLKELHSRIMKLHAREEELQTPGRHRMRCYSEPKRSFRSYVSSPSCISEEVISPKAASVAVKDVLECTDEEAQKHLKTFFEVMDTSPPHVAYKIEPKKHRDWRCLAEQVGLHENDLSCINSEKRLRIVFNEWDKRECVTVAKVYQVLVESQCTRAAECLRLAAQSMVEQEQREDILDLGGTCNC